MQAYSVLDFSTIIEGEGASEALAKSLQLAQAAEANGYTVFGWQSIIIFRPLPVRRQRLP